MARELKSEYVLLSTRQPQSIIAGKSNDFIRAQWEGDLVRAFFGHLGPPIITFSGYLYDVKTWNMLAKRNGWPQSTELPQAAV